MEHTARLALVEQCLGDSDKFTKVLYELRHLINYILENPHDYELRTIKSELLKLYFKSEAFKDYLKYVGFQPVENQMTYPKEQTLNDLRIAKAAIERKIGFCCDPRDLQKAKPKSGHSLALAVKPKLVPSNVLRTNNSLLLKIQDLFNRMIIYEDEELQQLARDEIPLVTLHLMALDRVREQQKQIKTGATTEPDLAFDIALLMELLGWFKYKYFKWVDKPDCDKCGAKTRFIRSQMSKMESETCTVEVYECTRCGQGVRFPRYNSPRTLLRTRRGRCGEWANCFTLLCRAIGYDTRYVYDTTDHVWCEVFDFDANTWLHVDPCEAKLNAPLIYSHGWGKKLSYVIAVSRDDLQDVTWRYCSDHKEVLKRRNKCEEQELIAGILELRESRQRQVSEARRRCLARRCATELAQLMVPRKPSDYENHGRISGSKEWRQERGELGVAAGHTFTFNEPGDISIRYYPATDVYKVEAGGKVQEIREWAAGAHSAENVLRKVEDDWHMVYLARTDNESTGRVSWRMSAGAGEFSGLRVRAAHTRFQGAAVRWLVAFDARPAEPAAFTADSPTLFENRFKSVLITAHLSGGRGDTAWQHAQLFRAPTDHDQQIPAFQLFATLVASTD